MRQSQIQAGIPQIFEKQINPMRQSIYEKVKRQVTNLKDSTGVNCSIILLENVAKVHSQFDFTVANFVAYVKQEAIYKYKLISAQPQSTVFQVIQKFQPFNRQTNQQKQQKAKFNFIERFPQEKCEERIYKMNYKRQFDTEKYNQLLLDFIEKINFDIIEETDSQAIFKLPNYIEKFQRRFRITVQLEILDDISFPQVDVQEEQICTSIQDNVNIQIEDDENYFQNNLDPLVDERIEKQLQESLEDEKQENQYKSVKNQVKFTNKLFKKQIPEYQNSFDYNSDDEVLGQCKSNTDFNQQT
eukprot:403359831